MVVGSLNGFKSALALLLRQLLAWVGQRFVVVRRVPVGPVAARTVTTTPAETAA